MTVSVLNGSGASNQATTTAQSLQALGFHIGTIGDSAPVGREAETVVYYAAKTPAQLAAAQAVANSLSGAVIMGMDPTQVKPGSQVTVVTGTDFTVDAPPATSTTAPSSATAPSTTTTTSGNSGNTGNSGAFQAPTATVEALQPWDPRSCTPSGGREPKPKGPGRPARGQTKISPPLVSSAWPVMAEERSDAR